MRRLLRLIFWVGPCRLYLLGEATGGAVPFAFLFGLFGFAAALGGVFALIAVVVGASVGDYFFTGAMAGLGTVTAWAVYACLVFVVLWIRGISPAAVPGVLPTAPSTAKHAATTSDTLEWRRRGQPLIPGSLVAFFALMAAVCFADGYFSADQGAFEAPLATATAQILRYDDGPGGFGDRYLEVRFTAGDGHEVTTRVKAEDRVEESRVPDPGGIQEVEYVITNPTQARPAGATQSKKSDAEFSRYAGYTCLTLAALTGAAYLVGRRKRHGADPNLPST
ncbi:hypothetical protein BWI15_30005 [Kribbella sp. ALI-6-A]|uniref:hypothetical protein n=1 Tax=Kribbella sp. ALI-6-A TaxID=1933817 RepID=UPI00097C6C8C|nr:hypothetical protein [Kribbella sp. ALI-6-A]ONI67369.1 hypothetical protein BWI15_30005 [Kribbella sp. ALI-6-A]